MNTARHASERLMSWPSLVADPALCGAEVGLRTATREIVHFHGEHEADVHLSRSMIARLRPALLGSSAVRLRAGSGWVTVRLDMGSDIDLLATLVSAALQASSGALETADTLPDGCTRT
ncbi:luciferase family protein [Streptomyces sp. NPDC008121]|uniref:luciferase domain-containing protein n=1 Tax=Streptomyces sp. NPDC008121 TaxID=3364809 RepID=UPI0036E25AB8